MRADGASFELEVDLQFTARGSEQAVGGTATTVDGVASTLRGNGGNWQGMRGPSPVGRWQLVLQDSSEVRERFQNEEIEDILLVVAYEGRLPEWPM